MFETERLAPARSRLSEDGSRGAQDAVQAATKKFEKMVEDAVA